MSKLSQGFVLQSLRQIVKRDLKDSQGPKGRKGPK